MNLYLLSQTTVRGYDTYDSAIVAAETETEARETHPSGRADWKTDYWSVLEWPSNTSLVKVKLIGVAAEGVKPGVVLASFNAG